MRHHNLRAGIFSLARGVGAGASAHAEAMSAAAACMSETLRSALALVEHANAQVIEAPERRAGLRRIRDALESDCRFD